MRRDDDVERARRIRDATDDMAHIVDVVEPELRVPLAHAIVRLMRGTGVEIVQNDRQVVTVTREHADSGIEVAVTDLQPIEAVYLSFGFSGEAD